MDERPDIQSCDLARPKQLASHRSGTLSQRLIGRRRSIYGPMFFSKLVLGSLFARGTVVTMG